MGIPLSYNLRNLVVRKTTTIMAALGIALTVAVLLAMLSLVNGLRVALQSTGSPTRVLVVRKGATSELVSGMTREAERAIEWDCAQVLTRFFNYFDQWRYEDMADLFAEDGVWHRQGRALAGRAWARSRAQACCRSRAKPSRARSSAGASAFRRVLRRSRPDSKRRRLAPRPQRHRRRRCRRRRSTGRN